MAIFTPPAGSQVDFTLGSYTSPSPTNISFTLEESEVGCVGDSIECRYDILAALSTVTKDLQLVYHLIANIVGQSREFDYYIGSIIGDDLQCKYHIWAGVVTDDLQLDYYIGSIVYKDCQYQYRMYAAVVTKDLECDYKLAMIPVIQDCQLKYHLFHTVDITTGLLAHYRLDDNAANTVVLDDTLVQDGVLDVNTSTISTPAKHSTGLNLNSLHSINLTGLTSTSTAYTFCFWAKSSQKNTYDYMFDITNRMTLIWYGSSEGEGTRGLGYYDGSTVRYFGANNIADGTWHFLVFTFEPGVGVSLYVDNVKYGPTRTYSPTKQISGTVRIGSRYVGDYSFSGVLDDFRIYTRVLTASEQTELYTNGDQCSHWRNFQYQIGSIINDTVELKYRILKVAVGRSLEYIYNLGAGAVSANLQLKYDLFQLIGDSVACQYMIGSIVNDDVICKYVIRHAVSRDLQSIYDMGALAGRSIEFDYKLANAVTDSVEVDYQIGSITHRDLQAKYYIFKSVNKSLECSYHIGTIVSNSTQFRYVLYMYAGDSIQFPYYIGSIISSSVALRYVIRRLVPSSYALMYNIGTTAYDTIELKYGIQSAPIKMLQALYNLGQGPVGQSKELKYRIFSETISAVGRSTEFAYDIGQGAVGKSVELRYRMLYVTVLLMGKYQIKLRPGNPTHIQSRFNDLMGLYHFNEYAYSGAPDDVRDQSGYGHDGTVLGSNPYPTTEEGLFGRSCRLQPGGFIRVPHHDHFNLTSPLTIMFWMKPRVSFTNSENIIRKGTWSTNNYHVYLSSNGKMAFGSTDLGYLESTTIFQLNTWYHITCKFTGTHLYLYVNGYLDAVTTATGHPVANETDLYIGNGFNGNLDELIIQNQQLNYTRMIDYYLKQPTTTRTSLHPVGV